MTISSPRRAYLRNTREGYTLSAQYHRTKWWHSAKRGQEDRKPKDCPVAKRTSRENEGDERAEPGQLKQFVPSPHATHANEVSLLNKQLSIITPWIANGKRSVAEDRSKERNFRSFLHRTHLIWSNVPSIGINLKTDIHQSCAGRKRACLTAFGIAKILVFPAPSALKANRPGASLIHRPKHGHLQSLTDTPYSIGMAHQFMKRTPSLTKDRIQVLFWSIDHGKLSSSGSGSPRIGNTTRLGAKKEYTGNIR